MTSEVVQEPGATATWRALPAPWPAAFAWVEETVGGRVVAFERQARWRPAWFITVQIADGTRHELYLRCRRDEEMPLHAVFTLRREHDVQQALEQAGVKVPHVWGFCPQPEGILMSAIPGRDRFEAGDDAAYRSATIAAYMEELARAHAADPVPFLEVMGTPAPANAEENALLGFDPFVEWYRAVKPGPDPLIEFIAGWVGRNVPAGRDEVSWVQFDAGQFLHHEGEITGLMDVEFSLVGDPLADLGAMRLRDTQQPLGDLGEAFRHYAQVRGIALDRRAVNFHTVRFAILTPMMIAGALVDPPAAMDTAQWATWDVTCSRVGLEVIAEELGITLELEALPAAEPTRRDGWFLSADRVLADLARAFAAGSYDEYRLQSVRDLIAAARSADGLRTELDRRDRDDEEHLLGARPVNESEADAQLEALVLAAGPERDAELVRFLHRRLRRREAILAPAMRDLRGFVVQPISW